MVNCWLAALKRALVRPDMVLPALVGELVSVNVAQQLRRTSGAFRAATSRTATQGHTHAARMVAPTAGASASVNSKIERTRLT